jgi:hypothetical protein
VFPARPVRSIRCDQIGDDIVSTTLSPTHEPDVSTAPPAADQTHGLHLVSVLVAGLPAELGTAAEPARYTVPAVFSRQVTAPERARIEDPGTSRLIAAQVGADPGLSLTVSDRRLLIGSTNLAELRDGLAAAIGAMLAVIERELATEQDERVAAAQILQTDEHERVAAVAQLAAQVRFDPAGEPVEPR